MAILFASIAAAQSPDVPAPSSALTPPAAPTPSTVTLPEISPGPVFPAVGSATEILTNPTRLSPSIQMRGRIETEVILASQSQANREAIGELENGYGFRRVRLGAEGTVGDSGSWISEVELAGGSVRLRDVFVGLDAFPGVRQVRIGHFREPFSLEGMTSSNFITMLERSPMNVLAPARNWGVCGYWWPDSERMLLSVGAFRDGTTSNGQSLGNGGNWAFTTRLTGLPIDEQAGNDVRLVHVGGAFSQRTPPNGMIMFSPRTSSNLLTVEDNPGSPFLPSVNIPASGYQLYNLQAAGVNGPFSVQTEWTGVTVQQIAAGDIFVNGAYVAVSYFLTGEHRGYNRTRGSFDAVDVQRPFLRSRDEPRSGFGAFELSARLGYLDFDSGNLPPDVNGNPSQTRLYEATMGLNWYLNRNTRMMLNYTLAIPDRTTTTISHLFGLRTAIFW